MLPEIPTRPQSEIQTHGNGTGSQSEWTLMFYIAGDSGLSASMISQLKELNDAGFQENTNVLVYFDPNCNGRNARIFDVNRLRKNSSQKKTIIGDGRDPYVRNIAEDCNTQGLPQMPAELTLRYFLEYCRVYYRAKNYMLFLMGHGVIVGNDAFLPDADDDSAITLTALGKILSNFAKKVRGNNDEFHLVGFHSCSMNSVELICQLAGTARYMVGTQGAAFPGSWPYRQLLKKIFLVIEKYQGHKAAASETYPNEPVREILTRFQDLSFYNAEDFWLAGFSADIAMCSLDKDKVSKLNKPLKELVSALKMGLSDETTEDSILQAHRESQSYWGESYTDLYDFCKCLQKYCKVRTELQAAISSACEEVKDVLESDQTLVEGDPVGDFNRLVIFSDYYGPAYQYSNGLSIYFPWVRPAQKVINTYQKYLFTQQDESNSWLSFLEEYFHKTQRELRPGKGKESPIRRPDKPVWEPPEGRDWYEKISDENLLKLGPPPDKVGSLGSTPDKVGSLASTPDKVGSLGSTPDKVGSLGSTPDKVGSLGSTPDKVGSLGSTPDKVGSLASTPDKVGSLGSTPDKVGSLGSTPDKVGSLASTPDKVGSLGSTPGKVGSLGLPPDKIGSLGPPGKIGSMGIFGLTVIKNFSAPENIFVTSRPKGNPADRRESSPQESTKGTPQPHAR